MNPGYSRNYWQRKYQIFSHRCLVHDEINNHQHNDRNTKQPSNEILTHEISPSSFSVSWYCLSEQLLLFQAPTTLNHFISSYRHVAVLRFQPIDQALHHWILNIKVLNNIEIPIDSDPFFYHIFSDNVKKHITLRIFLFSLITTHSFIVCKIRFAIDDMFWNQTTMAVPFVQSSKDALFCIVVPNHFQCYLNFGGNNIVVINCTHPYFADISPRQKLYNMSWW